nr:putative transcription repressor ofp9 [Quercus suber]
MKASRQYNKKPQLQQRGCRALCCSCRLSVSSSEEAESSNSDRFASISSLAHAMVQERLDQMIRERQEARQVERRRQSSEGTKFIVMVALEKCSYDPREDFRESMVEMIMTNRIQDPKDLRSLLNYYVSMNSDEYHGTILEVFHEDPQTDVKHPFREANKYASALTRRKIDLGQDLIIFDSHNVLPKK